LLEQQSNRIYEGEEPDFELIHDVMQYMTIYPDAVHHPKEDRLYAELKTVRPDLSAGFDRITVDHRTIAEEGMRLRDDIASIDSGSFIRRKKVVADALRYVNDLRSHMQWEELDLFRRCEEMAREGHEIVVDTGFVDKADPLFGDEAEGRFRHLLDGIEMALKAKRT
jgi:hemerythrin-like domain-containing protein